ncbi:uncharacterized protein LOC132741560 [Ruditapes philippinarum]|uniref:uncharacterized protein LOC132741560 n=1 Tax=Ruditapes philippinarum TaxID=129788 RepID=UPI00295BD606|nr:uncharacterized protein LOC132741560 [Ruditapes philippinarum]
MFKLLAVCLFAFAIAKWNQNVQATDELDAEEKRLLEILEEGLEQTKRDSDNCYSDTCDPDCQMQCCLNDCDNMDCLAECYGDQDKRIAADKKEQSDDARKRLWFSRRRRRRVIFRG